MSYDSVKVLPIPCRLFHNVNWNLFYSYLLLMVFYINGTYCHALGDRRRGIGLTIGFVTIVHSSTIQLSLSGLPQSYNSRLNISLQLCSHCLHRNCSSGILCQHYPGCCQTAGSLPLSLDTNSTPSPHQLNYSLRSQLRTPRYMTSGRTVEKIVLLALVV
jgi:hypothetical protein